VAFVVRPRFNKWDAKLSAPASGIAEYLLGKIGQPEAVVGPLCSHKEVPRPYFVVGTVAKGGSFQLCMVQVNDEADRAAIIALLAMKQHPLVMHVRGDEPSAAKWCHTIWPCEKTENLRDHVQAD
jgi:hypothetical protein